MNGRGWKSTHHATIPGNAAYDPETQKNVPKYFTPAGTSEMLIAKPMAHIQRPARINGERILILSDQYAKMRRIMAAQHDESQSIDRPFTEIGTYLHRHKGGP